MKRILTAFVLLAAACSSGYGPLSGRSHGYREREVGANQFVVEYFGDRITNGAGVRKLALYRAAELARSRGASHFRILDAELHPVALPAPGYGSPSSYRSTVPEGLHNDPNFHGNGGLVIGRSVGTGAESISTWSDGQFHIAALTIELRDQPGGAGVIDAAKLLGELKPALRK